MHVQCTKNKKSDLPNWMKEKGRFDFGRDPKFPLNIGQWYPVYAVALMRGCGWYFVNDDLNDEIPFWRPSPLFKITESSLSRFWEVRIEVGEDPQDTVEVLAVPEWIQQDHFYNNLVDRCNEEVRVFFEYKRKMDLEFPSPSIEKYANIESFSDQGNLSYYVSCPECCSIWRAGKIDAITRCDECRVLLNNPYYIR